MDPFSESLLTVLPQVAARSGVGTPRRHITEGEPAGHGTFRHVPTSVGRWRCCLVIGRFGFEPPRRLSTETHRTGAWTARHGPA